MRARWAGRVPIWTQLWQLYAAHCPRPHNRDHDQRVASQLRPAAGFRALQSALSSGQAAVQPLNGRVADIVELQAARDWLAGCWAAAAAASWAAACTRCRSYSCCPAAPIRLASLGGTSCLCSCWAGGLRATSKTSQHTPACPVHQCSLCASSHPCRLHLLPIPAPRWWSGGLRWAPC